MEQDLSSSMLASVGLDRTERAVWTIDRSAKEGREVGLAFRHTVFLDIIMRERNGETYRRREGVGQS